MRGVLSLVSLVLAIAAVVASPPAALAQDKAAADAAFSQGKRLLEQGETAAACSRFESSLRLLEQLGVRLNLADCHERLGRLSAAHAEFRAAEIAARRARDRRVGYIRDRIAALDRRIPHLRVDLAVNADLSELVIERDGVVVDRGLQGSAMPLDPGLHTVEVTAPGRLRWSTQVELSEGERRTIEVPALEPARAEMPARGAATGDREGGTGVQRPARAAPAMDQDGGDDRGDGSPGRTRRIIAYSAAGAGLAAAGTGLIVGLHARAKWSDARADGHCDDDGACDRTGYPIARDARRAATTSTILVGAGAAAVAAGVVVYLTAPGPGERRDERARLVPVLGSDVAGLAVLGGF